MPGRQLDIYFQFYAAGEHRAEIVYEEGSTQAATFVIPEQAPAELRTELDPSQPNCFLFQQTEPRFGQILASLPEEHAGRTGRNWIGETVSSIRKTLSKEEPKRVISNR